MPIGVLCHTYSLIAAMDRDFTLLHQPKLLNETT